MEIEWGSPEFWAKIGAAAIAIASVVNMFVSSDSALGKIVNAIALGFGKAKPDPTKQ